MFRIEFPRKGKLRVLMHEYNRAFLTLWSFQRFANVNVFLLTHGSAENSSGGSEAGLLKTKQTHA